MGLSDAWHARAAMLDPADLDLLLDALSQTHLGRPTNKILELRQWPRDPRIAHALATLFEKTPWTGFIERQVRQTIISVLSEYTDVPETARRLHRWTAAGRGRSKPFGRMTHTKLTALPSTHPVAIPDDPDADALGERALAIASTPGPAPGPAVEDLWAAVWEEPDELGRRAVLADALQADGVPLGEFMQLQLMGRPGTSSREKQLLTIWQREWLGELEPFAARSGNLWRNGLLHKLALARAIPSLDCPSLRAVRHLHTAANGNAQALLAAGRLPRLTHLTGIHAYPGEELGHPGVTHLGGLRWNSFRGVQIWMASAHQRFPSLKHLSLRWSLAINATHALALAKIPIVRQLESIELPGRHMPDLLEHLETYARFLEQGPHTILLVPQRAVDDEKTSGWRLELQGRILTFILGGVKRQGLSPTEQVAGYLSQIPPGIVDSVQIVSPKRAKIDLAALVDLPWPIALEES